MEDKNIEVKKKSNQILYIGLGAFGLLSFLIIFLPVIITKNSVISLGVEKPNEIGDTIGGIMGPSVALLGALLTFLAFWAQYAANEEQRNQFIKALLKQEDDKKEQQFENHFFEMLRLHKENVNELSTVNFFKRNGSFGYLSDKPINGRQVFFEMNNILKSLFLKSTYAQTITFNKTMFIDSYKIFYNGLNACNVVDEKLTNILFEGSYSNNFFDDYNGVSYYLGHYFRHLFLTVKFVVDSKVITDYEEKMKYLKILRAQLSNYEQIFLFYNWLSGYGADWENETNKYFTEYKMMHNLLFDELFQDEYIVNEVNDLIEKYNKNNKGKKPLFAFQGKDFEKKMELIKKETNGK